MNKIKVAILSIVMLAGVVAFVPSFVAVASPADKIGDGVEAVGGDEKGNQTSLGKQIQNIVNILLYVLGAIAVVMIVLGGIRYATSNGDSSAITGAKNTILYAVVGLIVAILAYAIVDFVVSQFAK